MKLGRDLAIEQDVGSREVAVHDALELEVAQSREDLERHALRLALWKRPREHSDLIKENV